MSWLEWEALIVRCLFIAIPAVIFIVRMIREDRYLFKQKIPGQLVQLVMRAHDASTVGTLFDIRVSPEMRDALCAPLTQEQLETMRAAEKGVYSTYVKCQLISSRFKGGELSGVVKVSVRVSSRFSERPLVCPEVKLKITVSSVGKPGIEHRWVVTSVEQIA